MKRITTRHIPCITTLYSTKKTWNFQLAKSMNDPVLRLCCAYITACQVLLVFDDRKSCLGGGDCLCPCGCYGSHNGDILSSYSLASWSLFQQKKTVILFSTMIHLFAKPRCTVLVGSPTTLPRKGDSMYRSPLYAD